MAEVYFHFYNNYFIGSSFVMIISERILSEFNIFMQNDIKYKQIFTIILVFIIFLVYSTKIKYFAYMYNHSVCLLSI